MSVVQQEAEVFVEPKAINLMLHNIVGRGIDLIARLIVSRKRLAWKVAVLWSRETNHYLVPRD